MGFLIFGLFLALVLVAANYIVVAYYNDTNEYKIKDGRLQKKTVNKSVVLASAVIPLILFTFIASTENVANGEIAVMTRFGRVTGQELGAGFHFKNPVDVANKYNIQVQKEESDASAASKDLQDVNGKVVVNYNLEAGKVFDIHKNIGPLYKEKLIDPAIQEVFKSSTAKFDATSLITNRGEVKNEVKDALSARLKKYGIVVSDISITNFQFSKEFNDAIEAKQVAQQQAEQAKFLADKAANEAQAAINKAKGEAESQSLLNSTASEKTIELKKLEVQQSAINKWNGVLPTTTAGDNLSFLLQPTN